MPFCTMCLYCDFSLLITGLHKINRYLVCGLHPSGDAEQPAAVPRQALPRPAQPHPGRARLSLLANAAVHPQ